MSHCLPLNEHISMNSFFWCDNAIRCFLDKADMVNIRFSFARVSIATPSVKPFEL